MSFDDIDGMTTQEAEILEVYLGSIGQQWHRYCLKRSPFSLFSSSGSGYHCIRVGSDVVGGGAVDKTPCPSLAYFDCGVMRKL